MKEFSRGFLIKQMIERNNLKENFIKEFSRGFPIKQIMARNNFKGKISSVDHSRPPNESRQQQWLMEAAH